MIRKLLITTLSFAFICLPLVALAGTIQLPKTGQTTSYGAGDDGAKQAGTAWPIPRFTDNSNGTITDNLSGLIWLKNANCSANLGGVDNTGTGLTWADALTWSNSLASGTCGLSDDSAAGQWRLPNRKELKSLINRQQSSSATWLNTFGFFGFPDIQTPVYWSSSTYAGDSGLAWWVGIGFGRMGYYDKTAYYLHVLPVRGGQ